MSIKVRKKDDSGSVTDMSLLIETSDRYLDWDNDELKASIMEETGINEEVAAEISQQVHGRLQELADNLGWTSVSTNLIREVVEQELLNKGRRYKNRAKKYRTLGLSEREITNIVENTGSRDNGNLGHNPDSVLFVSSETMVKQYALKHVFPSEVVDAHLQGDFSIHDLGAVFKIYAFSKSTEVEIRRGDSSEKITLDSLWESTEGEVIVVEEQEIKILNEPLRIRDRGKWVSLQRLIRHNENKEMRTLVVEGGQSPTVTSDHACLVDRGGRLLLVRSDEVSEGDLLVEIPGND